MLLLPDGQTGEAWEPSNKLMPFWESGTTYNQKYFVFFVGWEKEEGSNGF